MLYILLVAFGLCSSFGLQFGENANLPCEITYPFATPYVSAYNEQLTPGFGCYSNASTETQQEVHIINLLNAGPVYRNDLAEVNLLIKSRNDEVLWQPVIFVLNSHQSVRWKVKIEMLAPPRRRQIFVVPTHSTVRLVKSHQRRLIKKVFDIPQNRKALVNWVQDEYHAITSFTELKRGNRMELTVGPNPNASAVCKMSSSQPLYAIARYQQSQLLSGCSVNSARDSLTSVAYVIEVDKMTSTEVQLDIKSASRRTTHRNFLLVLKSSSPLNWTVETKRIQGTIDIVANSMINMDGIKVDTAGVRQDDIQAKGHDLIEWVNFYIGPVSLYASISQANKVVLVLPDTETPGSNKGPVTSTKTIVPPFENIADTKNVFNKALHTECHANQHMIVAFSKLVLQNFGLEIDQLTLRDPVCKAGKNDTHIILGLTPSNCGTRATESDGKTFYNNVLLVHRSAEDGLEETGSGGDYEMSDNEISGSGSHDPNSETYFDDEDFQNDAIKIEVKCEFIESEEITQAPPITIDEADHAYPVIPSWTHPNVEFKIKLYRSRAMNEPVFRYPMTVAPNSSIFVEVDIQPVDNLQVMIHSCWLSPHMDRQTKQTRSLVEKGCKTSSVRWIKNLPTLGGGWWKKNQPQKFSFNTGNQFQSMFIKCKLGVCTTNPQQAKGIPCGDVNEMCGKITDDTPGRLMVQGPMFLSDVVEPEKPLGGTVIKPAVDAGTVIKPDVDQRHHRPSAGNQDNAEAIVIQGLDSGTVVGIAFAAFIIGVLLMAALWFIHTHTGPIKHAVASRGGVLSGSGESTPMSTAPITINT